MSTPTLLWLQVNRYENFEPFRLDFSADDNLILGLNGAGKTQFLRLVRAALCLDFGDLVLRQPFDVEFELHTQSPSDKDTHVTAKVSYSPPPSPIDLDQAEGDPSEGLQVSLTIQGGGRSMNLRIAQGAFEVNGESFSYGGKGVLVAPRGPLRDKQLHDDLLVKRGACWIDEALAEFEFLVGGLVYTLHIADDHVEGVTLLESDRLRKWNVFPLAVALTNLHGSVLHEGVMLGDMTLSTGVRLERTAIESLLAPLRIDQLRLVPRVTSGIEGATACRGIQFGVNFSTGYKVEDPSRLTFGQRRYLYAGLLALFHPGSPIVADEVDNGMHPRLVTELLRSWSGRQLFLSSHNRLIVDSTNFYSSEDVRKKLHIVRRDERGRQLVRPLADGAAREIHEKIDVGILRPSDVLETEGLW